MQNGYVKTSGEANLNEAQTIDLQQAMASNRQAERNNPQRIILLHSRDAHAMIFRAIEKTSSECRRLRKHIFARISRSKKLQDCVLATLAEHPMTQRKMVAELGRDPRFRRRLLKLIGQQL
jgi:hypothetical protein